MKASIKENISIIVVFIIVLLTTACIGAYAVRQYNLNRAGQIELPSDDNFDLGYNGFESQEEYDEAKYLLKYHGVDGAYKDFKTGKWYFYRDGKVCELWNPKDRQ